MEETPEGSETRMQKVVVKIGQGKCIPQELDRLLGSYSDDLPPAAPPHASHSNIYHVIVGRTLQRCYHQEGGTWALYWDEGLFNVDPGWWLAETGSQFGEKALLWASGEKCAVPKDGWQMRGFLGTDYQEIPLKIDGVPCEELQLQKKDQSCIKEPFSTAYNAALEAAKKMERSLADAEKAQQYCKSAESEDWLSKFGETCRALCEEVFFPCVVSSASSAESAVRLAYLSARSHMEAIDKLLAENEELRAWKALVEPELEVLNAPFWKNPSARKVVHAFAGQCAATFKASVFMAWVADFREEKMQKADAKRREEMKTAGKKAAMALAGTDSTAFLNATFQAWKQMIAERKVLLAEEAKARELEKAWNAVKDAQQEATKQAAMQAGMALLGNNTKALLTIMFSSWVKARMMRLQQALADARESAKEKAMKAGMALMGNCEAALLVGTFSAWVQARMLSKQEAFQAAQDAAKESAKAAAFQAGMALLGNNTKALMTGAFAAWTRAKRMALAEMLEEARKTAKESSMKAGMALLGNNEAAIIRASFSAWARARALAHEEAVAAAREAAMQSKNTACLRAAMALFKNNEQALVQGIFAAWVRARTLADKDAMKEMVGFADEASLSVGRMEAELQAAEEALEAARDEIQALKEKARVPERMKAELEEARKQIENLMVSREKAHHLLEDVAEGKLNSYSKTRLREVLMSPDSYPSVRASRLMQSFASDNSASKPKTERKGSIDSLEFPRKRTSLSGSIDSASSGKRTPSAPSFFFPRLLSAP
eukprot:gb/GFBE01071454.1/.p1 GENE.gb/GFBE01071454.1/~~gb/GFBE01071454.1/.p1  ORF type:complete len:776 (+),score=223.94 gb/GFBE01071454.1/:1-2328(+)